LKNRPDAVVVVEPGLHQSYGHMRGELELFLSGLRANKIPFQVVGSEKPLSVVPEDWNFCAPSENFIRFFKTMPTRIGIRLAEFCAYFFALRLAALKGNPVIGLTSSGPFGPALASIISTSKVSRLFIVYHLGAVERRLSPWRWAYRCLFASGVKIGAYSLSVQQRLQKAFPKHESQVYFLPNLAAIPPLKIRSKNPEPLLIVSGLDSEGRRTPIRHLKQLGALEFPRLILHDPEGVFAGVLDLEKKVIARNRIERVSRYFLDDYSSFLSQADAVLIAYDPSFLNPSSVLRHSVCAGVPVISSRFPEFVFLENKFGAIGEAWEYNDCASLKAAIERFLSWGLEDFQEFDRASKELRKYLSPPSVVCEHIKTMGFNMQQSFRQN
jgi:hypothetical protein